MSTRSLSKAILVPSGDQSDQIDACFGFDVSLFSSLPLGLALKISMLSVFSTYRKKVILPSVPPKVAREGTARAAAIAAKASGRTMSLEALVRTRRM